MNHYAYIKDSKVVNIIWGNNLSDEFISLVKEEYLLDEVILVEDGVEACIGNTYTGTEFIPNSPSPSFIWDSNNKKWVAPIPYPEDESLYHWNEETQAWDKVASLPNPDPTTPVFDLPKSL